MSVQIASPKVIGIVAGILKTAYERVNDIFVPGIDKDHTPALFAMCDGAWGTMNKGTDYVTKALYYTNKDSYDNRYPFEPTEACFPAYENLKTYIRKYPIMKLYKVYQYYLYQIERNTPLLEDLKYYETVLCRHVVMHTEAYNEITWGEV